MSVWILKAVIQKGISFLPYSHKVNFLFQKYVTRGVLLSDVLFDDKLTHCARHIQAFDKYAGAANKKSFTALEIGTGWYPIVPIGLFLAGANKIYTIDISPLLSKERITQTIERYLAYKDKLPFTIDNSRLNILKSLLDSNGLSANDMFSQMNIVSIVGDARKTELPGGCIDLINSNNTFEHIYPEILIDILKEFKRIGSNGGVMSHAIDMSDHFAHLDKSITPYNFLKYSDAEWSWIDNSVQPQNRMRLYEHEALYKQADIPITEKVITGAGNSTITNIKVDKRFSGHTATENAILHAAIISQL